MPLPTSDDAATEWPPPYVAKYTRQQQEWAAWWAGDAELLRRNTQPRRFWARQTDGPNGEQTRALHVALAADIVSTSAALLFGEPVELRIPEPEATGDQGKHVDTTDPGTGGASLSQEAAAVQVTQARLDELREELALDLLFLEAGEVAAALGGAWLRPAWDKTLADRPIATVVDPQQAVPEYRMRQLVAVTFWENLPAKAGEDGSSQVWRHLERHEARVNPDTGRREGVILHGLYLGDKDRLGTRRSLDTHHATAGLDDEVKVPEAAGAIAVQYMPNVLPNRRYPKYPIGRSDFDGAEDELDALDEVWSSLLRDIRLGKVRIFAPEGTLDRAGKGPGSGRTFDADREVIVETDVDPESGAGRVALLQGSIRDTAHLSTTKELTAGIVSAAGYSPQTFGLDIEGQAESGTALNVRERKTFNTLRRKRGYAGQPVAGFALALLAIDAEIFGRQIVPMRPRVEWPDVTQDAQATATRLQALRVAQAISIRHAVREAQPELSDPEVDEEVARILAEVGVANPDEVGADQPGDPDAVDEAVA